MPLVIRVVMSDISRLSVGHATMDARMVRAVVSAGVVRAVMHGVVQLSDCQEVVIVPMSSL